MCYRLAQANVPGELDEQISLLLTSIAQRIRTPGDLGCVVNLSVEHQQLECGANCAISTILPRGRPARRPGPLTGSEMDFGSCFMGRAPGQKVDFVEAITPRLSFGPLVSFGAGLFHCCEFSQVECLRLLLG